MITPNVESASRSGWMESLRCSPVAYWTGVLHVLLFLSFAVLSVVDPRTVDGLNNWYKPMKFVLSIAIFAFTVSILSVPLERIKSRGIRRPDVLARIICYMLWGEIILISLQAARGERSHFNIESALGGIIYSVMGLMILVSTIATVAFLLPYFSRSAEELQISRMVRRGIQVGTILFVLGSVAGGIMSSLLTHSVGDPGLHRIPFLGWSTTAGDIRTVHFLGLHAIQVLPLAAWWLKDEVRFRWVSSVLNWSYGIVFALVTTLTAMGLSVVFWL